MNSLADALIAALPEHRRVAFSDRAQLEAALVAALDRARAAWPDVEVETPAVIASIAERLGDAEVGRVELERLAVSDLYLACACATGAASALRAFEARYFVGIDGALGRLGMGRDVADEVRQIVREQLFVAQAGRRPRVLELAGKGDLGALVRLAAVRAALNLRRATHRLELVEHPSLVSGIVLGVDAATDPLKAEQRATVERAFAQAVTELDVRDRNILRMHVLHGLSIDEIGRIHAAHRATAARWLERIREQLRARTIAILRGELVLGRDEVESLIDYVKSGIAISFARLLD